MNIFEIVLLGIIIYYTVKAVQGTRVMVLAKGFAFLGCIYALSIWLKLHVIQTILWGFFIVAAFTMVIIFNSEIRRVIEKIGSKITTVSLKELFKNEGAREEYFSFETIKDLADAVVYMSERKTGALIVLEKDVPIKDIIDTGLTIDAKVSSQLLINIFEKNTPLHDGAVVISNNRVVAATCILPLTQQALDRKFGTRHRAAVGVCESADCCALVVSEETGAITFVYDNGKHVRLKDRAEVMTKLKGIQEKASVAPEKKENNILNRAQHNFSLKLISSIAAGAIWATMTLINDPMVTLNYTVPIHPVNESALTEVGQIYELEQEKVKVNVEIRTSHTNKMDADKIKVTADMSKLSYTNAVPLSVTIDDFNTSEYKATLSTYSINVKLDEITEASIPVKLEVSGEVKEGFYLSSAKPVQESILIKCGASLAKTIDAAYVNADAEGLSENFTKACGYTLKDKNGHVISSQNYSGPDTCDIAFEISKTKTIPVEVIVTEELKEVYNIQNIETDKKEIVVIGSESALANISKYDIIIDNIEISDAATKKFIKTVTPVLPDNLKLHENSSNVTVEIAFIPVATKVIEIKPADIEIKNLDEKLKLEILGDTIPVTIYSSQEDVAEFTAKNIKPFISAEALSEGEYNLMLQFETKVYAAATAIKVKIVKEV